MTRIRFERSGLRQPPLSPVHRTPVKDGENIAQLRGSQTRDRTRRSLRAVAPAGAQEGRMFTHKYRCYDCGLDYRRKAGPLCPRCGEVRVVPRFSQFNDNPGPGWKLIWASSPNASGQAAAELRRQGNDAMWRVDNPKQG